MQALRSFCRAVPRASFRALPARSISSTSSAGLLRPRWQAVKKPLYPAFSTSIARREPAGESDAELSEKFNLERQLELSSRDPSTLPATIEDFLQNSSWAIEDKPGTHEATLTRSFGNETIKIEFSIADMNQLDDEYDQLDEDVALEDEVEYEQSKRTINQSGTKGGKVDVVAEDSVAPADRAEDEPLTDESDLPVSYPLNLIITITKPASQAIEIRATAEDGNVDIESVSYFPRAELIEAKTPEDAQESRGLYAGPPFRNLDVDLQAMFEGYLEERGINAQLATFLPEYVDFKEQREYVQWLENMKGFIDA